MKAWRTLGVMLSLLVAIPTVGAQTYTLAETLKAGDCFRVQLEMKVSGKLRVSREGKPFPLDLTATANHAFPERILNIASTGLAERSARSYETATAEISVQGGRSQRTLRPERRLIVAQRHKDQPLVYCPTGPLTREEVELAGEHFDTLSLIGLLPGKAVAVGDTWKVANPVVQALCHFDGVTEQALVCKLEKVEGKVAQVSVAGPACGIESGALAKLQIQATYHFDLDARRLTRLEWKQQDEREQGPTSPASTLEATTIVKRTPIDEPASLANVALVSVPAEMTPPEPMTHLDYRDARDRFGFSHGREWQRVGQTDEHIVLRMLDRGDLVAQLTVTPWTRADKGKHMTPEAFKQAMADTPGWQVEKELQAGEVPAGEGRWVYRVSAVGKMDGMDVLQNFYLVAGPDGEQLVLVFTMAPKQAERLGTRDLSIAGSIDFPSMRKEKDSPRRP